MHRSTSWIFACLLVLATASMQAQGRFVEFSLHSARNGKWSDPSTWTEKHTPHAGDYVQIRAGNTVVYDVDSDQALRVLHIAGALIFSRDRSTRLDVGLIKIQPGEQMTEDGFNCDAHPDPPVISSPHQPLPTLEIGTWDRPIPPNITVTIRLVYFEGADKETNPAIIVCGGRWEVHGAPLSHTWVKLGGNVKPGDTSVLLNQSVSDWKAGDHLIITASKAAPHTRTFRPGVPEHVSGNTEERRVVRVEGAKLILDRPVEREHIGEGAFRSEVANLSRSVVIESATPNGVRGHTMYHKGSAGSISYAEFRHLGKEGVLGKYPIHFHLTGRSMRGAGVIGASIWDSDNRWITIHGTDYLLIRDCVGYQSVGHGYFLEDGTEQYNVLDHNLAVQAYRGKKLPKQVLSFDENEGAGFWWANGRNTFIHNVACENDEYGFRFEIATRDSFNPVLELRMPDGSTERKDVRTLPFLRFEGNESHSEGLYSFNFGDDINPSVHGDRTHPFIARNLLAWESHYVLRPDLQFFLMDGLTVYNSAYGVYHPDYDSHVYRNIYLNNVDTEPINRGHDDDSIQYGTFTYEHLTLENCRVGRDPLIQLTCTSPKPGQSGHFRDLLVKNSLSHDANVVDLGGGPRNTKLENGVVYYFHDYPSKGRLTKVVSDRFQQLMSDGTYSEISGFTGKDVRACEVAPIPFPVLLQPVDDLPPATLITSVTREGNQLSVKGVSEDNGDIIAVTVNGRPAVLLSNSCGIADWRITLPIPVDGLLAARATDRAGNVEKPGHVVSHGAVSFANAKRH